MKIITVVIVILSFSLLHNMAISMPWGPPPIINSPDNDLKISLNNSIPIQAGSIVTLEVKYLYPLFSHEKETLYSQQNAFYLQTPPGFTVIKKEQLIESGKFIYTMETTNEPGIYNLTIRTYVPKKIECNYSLFLYSKEMITFGFNPKLINKGYYRSPLITGVLNLIPLPLGLGYIYNGEPFSSKNDPTTDTYMISGAIRTIPIVIAFFASNPYKIIGISGIIYDTYNCISLTNKKNAFSKSLK